MAKNTGKRPTTPTTSEMFQLLVQNAVDFLERATDEIETRPKYSVINFFTAVELLFKARLMLEHWSLIIDKPERANLGEFFAGNFKSVTLDQAVERLKNIVNEDSSKDEKACFNQIREHRNKLVHFYHPEYADKPDAATVQAVVAEFCKGWLYLHRLLTGKWRDHFAGYEMPLKHMTARIQHLREFLRAKYEFIRPIIERDRKLGITYASCPSCGFAAAREEAVRPPLVRQKCLVCNWSNNVLKVPCPSCQSTISTDAGEGTCDECETQVGLDYLLAEYGVKVQYRPPDEPEEDVHAYCVECETQDEPSVVPYGDDWLCLACSTLHRNAEHCDYCGEFFAGELDNTYLTGCVRCDGMIANASD